MPRALFEKTGNAIYISHLDLMRVFQRAFKRAGLPLTHTQGYNPRPSVSIALPLSLGVESKCELLDFDLTGEQLPNEEIMERLNRNLIDGVRVLQIFEEQTKLKYLSLLKSKLTLEYDIGVPENAVQKIAALLSTEEVFVEKKGKNGITEQNISSMIRKFNVEQVSRGEVEIHLLACCQNPTLNPMQVAAAIEKYLPELKPDFVRCCRLEIYDEKENVYR